MVGYNAPMRYHVIWGCGQAGRCTQEEYQRAVGGDYGPTMGRYWCYWYPRIGWNHGLPWRDQVTDVALHWLWYWVGFMSWRHFPSAEN